MEARRRLYEVLKAEYEKIVAERGGYQYIMDNPNATNDESEKEEAKNKIAELEESAEVFKAELVNKAKDIIGDLSKERENTEKSKKKITDLIGNVENEIKLKEEELKLILESEDFKNNDDVAIFRTNKLRGEIETNKVWLGDVRSKIANLEKQIQ